MSTYNVRIRLSNGTTVWMDIEARSSAQARAIAKKKTGGRPNVTGVTGATVKPAANPHRKRRGPPRGKTPPHLKKYLFKKGHR
jgi:hypothetical protein